MPRVVVFSDVHGNLAALEAVWTDIKRRKPDYVLCLGDLAAFGPNPSETLQYLQENVRPSAIIRGNTDRWLLEKIWTKGSESGKEQFVLDSLAWTADKLGPSGLEYLAGLPAQSTFDVDGFPIMLCHASPGQDEIGFVRGELDELGKRLEGVQARAVVCGHTHIPLRTRLGQIEVLNVGSVGFPYDRDFRPCYLSFFIGDSALQEITFCRVPYSRSQAMEAMEGCGMPGAAVFLHRMDTATFGRPKSAM